MRNPATRRLIELLTTRMRQGEGSSLRACAREIGISPATLSGFINHRRVLSPAKVNLILAKVPMSPEDRSFIAEGLASDGYEPVNDVPDIHRIVDSIYFFAVLDLLETAGAERDEAWIAARLRLSKADTATIVAKLKELGLLIASPAGHLQTTGKMYSIGGDGPRPDMRALFLSTLAATRTVMDRLDEKTRWEKADTSSIVVPVDAQKLAEAKRRIKEFRRSLADFLGAGARNEVYMLSINLVPLTDVR